MEVKCRNSMKLSNLKDIANKKWSEVMNLAKKYGFIIQAYGGTAVLATHEVQLKEFGKEKYEKIQAINS